MCPNLIAIDEHSELNSLSFDSECFFILGAGTNVAFLEDYAGDIITFTGKSVQFFENTHSWTIRVGAGMSWHALVEMAVDKGIGGLENLALIPGFCGAAAVQNIGAYGVEFSSVCKQVKAYDLKARNIKIFSNGECEFGYRNSLFKSEDNRSLLIIELDIELTKNWQPIMSYKGLSNLAKPLSPKQIFDRVVNIRQQKLPDPEKLPNAGSFFKNPVVDKEKAKHLKSVWQDIPCYVTAENKMKISAGWLIERVGFKGVTVGQIGTFQNHALVVINHGDGTGPELLEFVRTIYDKVFQVFGIKLENEVLLMGEIGQIEL